MAELGADALSQAVEQLKSGTAVRMPQDHNAYTYAPMLDRSLSPMDFTRSARQLHDQVRGLIPWPCASMELDGKNVKVYRTAIGSETTLPAATGGCCAFWNCRPRAASAWRQRTICVGILYRWTYERYAAKQRP